MKIYEEMTQLDLLSGERGQRGNRMWGGGGGEGAGEGTGRFLSSEMVFRKLMAAGSLFLGFYSSGGIDSTMDLILPRKR